MRPIARRALAAQPDERLVRLLREGHDPAFEEIVRRYRGPLVAFATAIVSHGRAEDVVQISLEKAHRALRADSREINLKPWLFTIVRNGALNTIRAEPLAEELMDTPSTVPGPAELAEQNDELERLVEAICALPDSQRQALVRRELEGEGHGEIAAKLGTSATAVRGLIFRARTSLRDAVGAILPLPVLRMLLTEGSTSVAAGGAAVGGGAGAAVLGGAGAKGGTVIAAAIVALGTGLAVERSQEGDGRPEGRTPEVAVRSATPTPEGDSPTGSLSTVPAATPTSDDAGLGGTNASGGSSERSGDGRNDAGSGSGSNGDAGSGPSGGTGSSPDVPGGPSGPGAGGEEEAPGGGPGPGAGGGSGPGGGFGGDGSGHGGPSGPGDPATGGGGFGGSGYPGGSSGSGHGGIAGSSGSSGSSSGTGSGSFGGDSGSGTSGGGYGGPNFGGGSNNGSGSLPATRATTTSAAQARVTRTPAERFLSLRRDLHGGLGFHS